MNQIRGLSIKGHLASSDWLAGALQGLRGRGRLCPSPKRRALFQLGTLPGAEPNRGPSAGRAEALPLSHEAPPLRLLILPRPLLQHYYNPELQGPTPPARPGAAGQEREGGGTHGWKWCSRASWVTAGVRFPTQTANHSLQQKREPASPTGRAPSSASQVCQSPHVSAHPNQPAPPPPPSKRSSPLALEHGGGRKGGKEAGEQDREGRASLAQRQTQAQPPRAPPPTPLSPSSTGL